MSGCLAAIARRPPFEMVADPRDAPEQPAAVQLVEEAERRTAGEQVAAVRAAVIAERDGVRDLLADQRGARPATPPPSALPIEIRSG